MILKLNDAELNGDPFGEKIFATHLTPSDDRARTTITHHVAIVDTGWYVPNI